MRNKGYMIIFTSLLLALMLGMLPLPHWATWIKPAWILLVLIYWCIALPMQIGLFTAFVIGLLLDVVNASVMGVHALAMVCVCYLAIRFHQQMRVFPLRQQSAVIFLLVSIYQLLLYLTQGMLNQVDHFWVYIFVPFTSSLLWPWLYILLRDVRRKFSTY